MRQGLAPADAASAARRQFGNATLLQEDRREMQTVLALEHAWRALRYSVRQLRITPGFTASAILSLALGIGVNTAVFTLLDQLVLRLLPVPSPERLVMIWSTGPNLGDTRGVRASSFPLCQTYQRRALAFDSVFCRYSSAAALTVNERAEPVTVELVSGNYFEALHVGPSAGRVFSANADDRDDRGHPVVVISFRYSVNCFGHRPDIVGKKILVNGHPMEVVGVASAGFNGMDPAQAPHIWLPLRMKALMTPEEDGLERSSLRFRAGVRAAESGIHRRVGPRLSTTTVPPGHSKTRSPTLRSGGTRRYDRDLFLKRRVLVERAATGYSDMREQYSIALSS